VLNAAAWLAFWVWVVGRADKSWTKVEYRPSDDEALPPAAVPIPPVSNHALTAVPPR
jgi:hypothetical protein